jgi:hypothetical protein
MQTFTQVQTQSAPNPTAAPKTPTFTLISPEGGTQTLKPPANPEEMSALRARRDQLSNQLESVADRRSELAQELARTTPEAARPGLEARIALLDQRILQLERDLATTGAQLSAAPPAALAGSESDDVVDVAARRGSDNFDEGMAAGAFTAVFFMSVILLFLRRRWKGKGKGSSKSLQLGADAAQRLERLETGMDAIAIEIERVSEGQRFVTKLLSESHGAVPPQQRASPQTVLQNVDPAKR